MYTSAYVEGGERLPLLLPLQGQHSTISEIMVSLVQLIIIVATSTLPDFSLGQSTLYCDDMIYLISTLGP